MKALSGIPRGGVAAFQVLFQAAAHPWENNIKTALEAEAVLKQGGSYHRIAPKELKDFFRKPLFAVRPRLVCSADYPPVRDAARAVIGEFQVEGKKVFYKSKADLEKTVSKKNVLEMFCRRESHMTGMLLTSTELSGFVHFPDQSVKHFSLPVRHLDGFRVPDGP